MVSIAALDSSAGCPAAVNLVGEAAGRVVGADAAGGGVDHDQTAPGRRRLTSGGHIAACVDVGRTAVQLQGKHRPAMSFDLKCILFRVSGP
jgi:hypothetical protein